MSYLLLMISVCLGAFKSVLSKASKNTEQKKSDAFVNNLMIFSAALFLAILLSVSYWETAFKGVSVLLAILYGIATFASQFFLVQATGCGLVALSTLFYSCNFLIPTVFGTVCYHEQIHWLYFVGVFFMLISFMLIISNNKKEKVNIRWLAYSIGGMFSAGIVGVIQKIFINEYAATSLNGFLIIAFTVIVALSFVLYTAIRRREKSPVCSKHAESRKKNVKEKLIQPLLGLIIGSQNILNIYIVGAFPSAVSFPVMNGGVILMTAVISAVTFKEKLTSRQVIAVVIGIIAIVCIGVGKILIG